MFPLLFPIFSVPPAISAAVFAVPAGMSACFIQLKKTVDQELRSDNFGAGFLLLLLLLLSAWDGDWAGSGAGFGMELGLGWLCGYCWDGAAFC